MRKNNELLNNLHPLTLLFYSGTLFVISMVFTHPLYLMALYLVTLICILSAGGGSSWKKYFIGSLFMGFFIVVANGLFSPYGNTTAFTVPSILMFAGKKVSWESLLYGMNMALKISLAFNIFCLYEALSDPDKSLRMFARFAPKSAVTAILTSLMLPRLKRDVENVSLAMNARGQNIGQGSLLKRVRSVYPLWKVILVSSLEGAWDTAESMHSRGFGTGKRTNYVRSDWLRRDWIICGFCALAVFLFTITLLKGKGFYIFYPSPGTIDISNNIAYCAGVSIPFLCLPLLKIGWEKWNYLRCKI